MTRPHDEIDALLARAVELSAQRDGDVEAVLRWLTSGTPLHVALAAARKRLGDRRCDVVEGELTDAILARLRH